jgi:uncharacterized repeat protein (TIGR01451 family)
MKRSTALARCVRRAIGLSAGALVLAAASSSSMAAIVCSSTPQAVPANIDGVYLNLVTGATGTSGSSTSGWDINLYMTGANALYFFWPTAPANSAGGASTATVYDALTAGAPIGSGQTYIVNSGAGGTAPFVNWQTTQTGKYLGIRFFNESTGVINYAWLQLDTGASGGFPAKINQYCYENAGGQILAGQGASQATPSLALATSGSPSAAGASVTFTATLSGNGTLTGSGAVTFCADAPAINATCGGVTPLCTVTASAVTATCATSALAVGTHLVGAYFSGDANNVAATSAPVSQVVERLNQAPLILTATPDVLSPHMFAQLSTSGGSGTGDVTYSLDSGPCMVVGSQVFALDVGDCHVSAYKAGDATYNPANATATIPITLPTLSLTIGDGLDFARYGQIVDYVVTLTNQSGLAANAVPVTFALSSGFDGALAQWECSGAGATCVQDDPLHYTVTLPTKGSSVTWLVSVPVRIDATEDDVTFSVSAEGKVSASDVNTLVIFRDGFDEDAAMP